jgi:hypothetical protein
MRFLILALALLAAPAAQAWEEPARGTQLRKDLMDAMRPHAMWVFGAPISFVVEDLRAAQDVGFASLRAIRPGGGEIGFYDQRPEFQAMEDPGFWDGPRFQVLYQKVGQTWVAVHHSVAATDAWWSDPAFCPIWHPVLPEICT